MQKMFLFGIMIHQNAQKGNSNNVQNMNENASANDV